LGSGSEARNRLNVGGFGRAPPVGVLFSAVQNCAAISFYLPDHTKQFLCAYLCVTELPSSNDTREISVFAVGSSPSEAANSFSILDSGFAVAFLIVDLTSALFAEKILQKLGALILQNTTRDFTVVIERARLQEVDHAAGRAAL
jgi:hypothetical protein